MRVRIIYGKLRPGTWDAYEAAYKEVAEQSGQIPTMAHARRRQPRCRVLHQPLGG